MSAVIYNFSGIRAPLTGLGRYAIELARPTINSTVEVNVYTNSRKYVGAEISGLIEYLERDTSYRSGTIRRLIGALPHSRSLERKLHRALFHRYAQWQINNGGICHDIRYAFKPGKVAKVTTVYDLSHLHFPETHPIHRVRFLERYFDALINSDTHIITISNAIKLELMSELGISSDRISVTHLGASQLFRPYSAVECQRNLEPFNLTAQQYLLAVGTLEPRKNLESTLDAYCSLSSTLQSQFPMIIAGGGGWKDKVLNRKVKRLQDKGLVQNLGYVPQEQLPYLYAGAAAFVFPSLYEGFGLPVLEAMQSGTPVITSNTGATAEVCGNGGLTVECQDSTQIASQLKRLLEDSHFRRKQSEYAILRSRNFSWANTVRKTHAIYETLQAI